MEGILKIIIVEDEILGQEALSSILLNFCADAVEVLSIASTVDEAVHSINNLKPDLVFLDIKLGANDSGAFDILQGVAEQDFKVIFTTSSEQPENILNALNNYNAKKYLLKPLSIDEVVNAVDEIKKEIGANNVGGELESIKHMLSSIKEVGLPTKIRLPVKNGFQYVTCEDIIMFRSNLNATLVFMKNGETKNSSKNLKYFEMNLPENSFLRVSKSFMININHVESYCNEDGGTIFLKEGCSAPLSGKFSKRFFEVFGS